MNPQMEQRPTLVPNVAGTEERRLIAEDQRLYRLGWSGPPIDGTIVIGAVAGTGRVLGIRDAPIDGEDFPSNLREYYEGFHSPAVLFINSSVAQYLECAWRWYAASKVLVPIINAPPASSDITGFYRDVNAAQRDFLRGLTNIDHAILADDAHALWPRQMIDG